MDTSSCCRHTTVLRYFCQSTYMSSRGLPRVQRTERSPACRSMVQTSWQMSPRRSTLNGFLRHSMGPADDMRLACVFKLVGSAGYKGPSLVDHGWICTYQETSSYTDYDETRRWLLIADTTGHTGIGCQMTTGTQETGDWSE